MQSFYSSGLSDLQANKGSWKWMIWTLWNPPWTLWRWWFCLFTYKRDTGPSSPARTAFEAIFISSIGRSRESLTDVVFVLLLSCICMHHWMISGALSSAANPPKIAQTGKNLQWLLRDFTFLLILCVHYTHFLLSLKAFFPFGRNERSRNVQTVLLMCRRVAWLVLFTKSLSLFFVRVTDSLVNVNFCKKISLCFDISGALLFSKNPCECVRF